MHRKKNRFALTAIPIAMVVGVASLLLNLLRNRRDGAVTEEVRALAQDASKEIDAATGELKQTIEGKSAATIERAIDTAIDNAKKRLDKIADRIKTKIRKQETANEPGTGREQPQYAS
jgi:hypothetical protein